MITKATLSAPGVHAPLRVGIIGGGMMARHHARAIARAPLMARVSAFAERDADARSGMAGVCPEAAVHESADRMLAGGGLDVIHVCTPPSTHESLAMAVLRAGCHAYVEKPFVESPPAARALLDLAEARKLMVCAGHQLLFEPPARRAADLLPAAGRLAHIESYFAFRPTRRSVDGRSAMRADQQLLDILPHPVYLLLHFLELAGAVGGVEVSALEVGADGTLHALVRQGGLTGSLVVTLTGRPVDSYLRLVGSNGSIHADFVRGTVQHQLGPGSSAIDKVLSPYRLSRQLASGTTASLLRRVGSRQFSYPGLAELIGAFYRSILDGGKPPVSAGNILNTVNFCAEAAAVISSAPSAHLPSRPAEALPTIAVTGATGFLGKAVARAAAQRGFNVLGLSRREPPPWERIPGVAYHAVDIADSACALPLAGVSRVIHCAAETSGSWAEHEANSVRATENVVRAAAAAGVERLVHVSSTAVLERPGRGDTLSEDSPLASDPRAMGPYVWGKAESERLAVDLGRQHNLDVRVARPGPIVDYSEFSPPGRLGRRLGNFFVAMGNADDEVAVVEVEFAAGALLWMAVGGEDVPPVLHLVSPTVVHASDLLQHLRKHNPSLTVLRIPRAALIPLSAAAVLAQKALRPSRPAVHLAQVFGRSRFDRSKVERCLRSITDSTESNAESLSGNLPSSGIAAAVAAT
jgi:predicted dehydrogenase/nucleoside-diphosphate-sugar epimerase